MAFQKIRDLLSGKELTALQDAPPIATGRYPTWYPVFYSDQRPVDHLSNQAVAKISADSSDAWLRGIAPRLCQMDDPEDASAALAELRAYGALLEAGFTVSPVPVKQDTPTPDFVIDAGDGRVVIEVFAKHQDGSEKARWEAVEAGDTPRGVERNSFQVEGAKIKTIVVKHNPGGAPDPNKPNDSVQANMISRICAVKEKEKQIPSNCPSLLWIDLRSFGGWPEAMKLEQLKPLISGHRGLTSGSLWYAFYGWKGAPIFEEDLPLAERIVTMGHDGRFRLQAHQKSKLSGVVLALSEGLALLENPWANHVLPRRARRFAERLPWFDLGHSICNWSEGDADMLAQLGRRQIQAFADWHRLLEPD